MASSPKEETPQRWTSASPIGRDSVLPKRVENTSSAFFCHLALYMIICPSGVNLADSTEPRRKVSRWNDGSGVLQNGLPAKKR